MRNESRNAKKELVRRTEREISIAFLPYDDLATVTYAEKYSLEELGVHMTGGRVTVYDRLLGQSIMSLAPKWRDIIAMYYFLDMSDEEIGAVFRITDGAVRHCRRLPRNA